MKKTIIFLTIYLSISFCIFSKTKFEINPIIINFQDIALKDQLIICYGSPGSIIISQKEGKDWLQKNIFDTQNIIKIYIEENRIVAFGELGSISISENKGGTWNQVENLDLSTDTILCILNIPNGYFIKTKSNLYSYDTNFNLISIKPFKSNIHKGDANKFSDTKSCVYFKNNIIVSTDTLMYYQFDSNLNLKDSFNLKNLAKKTATQYYLNLDVDSDFFYTLIDGVLYKSSDLKNFQIHNTKVNDYKIYNNQCYDFRTSTWYDPRISISPTAIYKTKDSNSVNLVSNYNNTQFTNSITANNFAIYNNKIFIMGNNKFLAYIDLYDTSKTVILSDYSGYSFSMPDKLNDSTYFHLQGYDNNYFDTYLYKTTNNGVTFTPVINRDRIKKYFNIASINFKYIDSSKIYLFCRTNWGNTSIGGVYTSSLLGQKFDFSEIVGGFNSNPINIIIPNMQKINNNFIFCNNTPINRKNYSTIFTYDENYNLLNLYRDSNIIIHYINTIDTNNFTILCRDVIDSTYMIKKTFNQGKNWEFIKKYNKNDTILFDSEIDFKNKKYLLIFSYDFKSSKCSLENLDLVSNNITTIYSYYKINLDYTSLVNQSITIDSNILYLAVEDTLFTITNLFDKTTWKKSIFPNNGKIVRTCKKFGDKIFARYSDDFHPDNLYWLKPLEIKDRPPLIKANDSDFQKFDIKDTNFKTQNITIYNPSIDSALIINGYSNKLNSIFETNLPKIDSINPLIIKPLDSLIFKVKFKPKIVGKYIDSITFYSNALDSDNVCIIKGEAIDTSKTDVKIETFYYFFAYPPYPLPASDEAKSHIFWSSSNDVNQANISVYNINGEKVSEKSQIDIIPYSIYDGLLKWNCSSQPSGIYLINIKYGDINKSIPVVVGR